MEEENEVKNKNNQANSFGSNTVSCLSPSMNNCAPLEDLVSANNHKNEKLTDNMSEVDYVKNRNEDSEDTRDDIDEDWFLKLINNKDGTRNGSSEGTIDGGLNQAEIPLLDDEDADFKERAVRTLKIGLKKIWRRGSATITQEDPTYKVAYLGNVLTGWAKGEGCIEKPLNTLWKNYNGSSKPDVPMKITVTQSGLKAITKAHGLIEYWSHRITYCTVPPTLPRIFCWIYRHEGKKLKQELRCHAVLCSKSSVATCMANTLKLRLTQALLDFKKDKLLRQKARLSFVNSFFDNPSLPRRKMLLATGYHNYKPPLERSKSAPKLMSIEEDFEEEESTPSLKRQSSEEETSDKRDVRHGNEEDRSKRNYFEDKCENYKLSNINFVKKICTSIENLVESTSFYGKKFFNERKSNKDLYFGGRIPEESLGLKHGSKEKIAKGKISKKVKSIDDFGCVEDSRSKTPQENHSFNLNKENEDFKEKRNQDSVANHKSMGNASSCCSTLPSLSALSPSSKSFNVSSKSEANVISNLGENLRLALLNSCQYKHLNEGSEIGHSEVGMTEAKEESKVNSGGEEVVGCPRVSNTNERLNLNANEQNLPIYKMIRSTTLEQGPLQSTCLRI